MSTKTLRTVVGMLGCSGSSTCIHCAANAELEAIEKAARVVVQEKALEDWNTAMPSDLASGIRTIQSIAKETGK